MRFLPKVLCKCSTANPKSDYIREVAHNVTQAQAKRALKAVCKFKGSEGIQWRDDSTFNRSYAFSDRIDITYNHKNRTLTRYYAQCFRQSASKLSI